MTDSPHDTEALLQRLERLSAALGHAPLAPHPAASKISVPTPSKAARNAGRGGLALAMALLAVGIALGWNLALILPALVLGVLSGALMLHGVGEAVLSSLPAGLAPKDPTRPHIGMGATIANDAIIEPGATVEMGATIGSGVVVKRGAVVRMGATVHRGAVLEEGAVVGWGADVKGGAVIGRNVIVGAGATISGDAVVPAGTRLLPGATWTQGIGARASAPQPAQATALGSPAPDAREARIQAACERIEAELRQAPEQVREYLGASDPMMSALRATCLGLIERERVLLAESSPDRLAFLDQEKAELDKRIAIVTDERVRRSLQQTVAAIEDQKRQRGLLRQSAERLDAELTRLVWTLEGMGAQLVRLRTAVLEAASAPDQEVLSSMRQLHDEIDAITDALEDVARADRERA
jgi:carbonic anhydrase/acetyltransferase-like protein (isoleucine patch superfamily)